MSSPFSSFFETNEYFIDEKVNLFKFENDYKVFNELGVQIGSIRQRLTTGQKLLRLLINKAIMPFKLDIIDTENILQASLRRGWTIWMSKITISDGQGNDIGLIQQKFQFFKPTFLISDLSGNQIASITGDWKAWNFNILDAREQNIGTINKKWGGLAKEIFTSADKYNVSIHPDVSEDNQKIAIVSTAITIDMVLKERK